MIDFHCHLDLYPDPRSVIRECEERKLYVLSVTTTPSAWVGTRQLAIGMARIRTSLGIHPQLVHERMGELPLFDRHLETAKYVGEVGLDGGPEFSFSMKDQIMVFDHVLSACREAGGKIISIHSRHACQEVLTHLERNPNAGVPVLHWFTGSQKDLERASGHGCWFSVGPAMLSTERGRRLVKKMPMDRVLTESDGPFVKVDRRSAFPWDVELAVRELASLWDVTVEEADSKLESNLRRLTTTNLS